MPRTHKTRVVYEVRSLNGWVRINNARVERTGWLSYPIGGGLRAIVEPGKWRIIVTAAKEEQRGDK